MLAAETLAGDALDAARLVLGGEGDALVEVGDEAVAGGGVDLGLRVAEEVLRFADGGGGDDVEAPGDVLRAEVRPALAVVQEPLDVGDARPFVAEVVGAVMDRHAILLPRPTRRLRVGDLKVRRDAFIDAIPALSFWVW